MSFSMTSLRMDWKCVFQIVNVASQSTIMYRAVSLNGVFFVDDEQPTSEYFVHRLDAVQIFADEVEVLASFTSPHVVDVAQIWQELISVGLIWCSNRLS